jgi:hypothetical protein
VPLLSSKIVSFNQSTQLFVEFYSEIPKDISDASYLITWHWYGFGI